jgi:hypothetical protein
VGNQRSDSLSIGPTRYYLLNPLSTPSWSIKRLSEVLRFVHYFVVFKLHYADGEERAAFIVDRVFRNPQFAGSKKPSNIEARRFAGVMAAEVLQIPFAVYAFTGLRVIADGVLVVDFMLDILISVRRGGPMFLQSGLNWFGCRDLTIDLILIAY